MQHKHDDCVPVDTVPGLRFDNSINSQDINYVQPSYHCKNNYDFGFFFDLQKILFSHNNIFSDTKFKHALMSRLLQKHYFILKIKIDITLLSSSLKPGHTVLNCLDLLGMLFKSCLSKDIKIQSVQIQGKCKFCNIQKRTNESRGTRFRYSDDGKQTERYPFQGYPCKVSAFSLLVLDMKLLEYHFSYLSFFT